MTPVIPTVSRKRVLAALDELLGSATDVERVQIGPSHIVVWRFVRGEDGRLELDPDHENEVLRQVERIEIR